MRWMIFALLAVATPAQAETWNCTFLETGKSGFIQPKVRFEIIRPYDDVRVADALISEKIGDWTSGKLGRVNAKRLSVTWAVPRLKGKANTVQNNSVFTGLFSITVLKDNGKAGISMGGWPQQPGGVFGTGRCEMMVQ
jgi:hypothetical protein